MAHASAAASRLRHVEVASPAEFDDTLARVAAEGGPVWVLFTGEKDASGVSWCPDCVVAEPAIHAAFAEAGVDGTLVTAWVKRSEYRGNPAYPYRTHKDIKLPAIPTLKFWSKKVKASLVEAQCTDCDLLRDIVELK